MEWIKIEDRTPEFDYTSVIVAVMPSFGGNETHMGYIKGRTWVVTSASGNHADFITHWMPLPEPPNDIEQ